MNDQDAFAKLLGRQPTAAECERLYRVRDALGLRDNDALWSVLIALEHYDACFRVYPERLEEVTAQAIDRARESFRAAAQQEAAHAQRALAERVAAQSVALAREMALRPVALHVFGGALAAVVVFGALCMTVGFRLGAGGTVFGSLARDGAFSQTGSHLVGLVLSMPAGWMVFALLVPASVYGARMGWRWATDGSPEWTYRARGWALVAVSLAGLLACAMLIAHVT